MANGRARKHRAGNSRKLIEYNTCGSRLKLCDADVGPARQIAVVLMTRIKWRLSHIGFADRPVVSWRAERLRRGTVSSHQR